MALPSFCVPLVAFRWLDQQACQLTSGTLLWQVQDCATLKWMMDDTPDMINK
jgi:hypothetical protein